MSGKITDAEDGSPVPFANVVFLGTQIGSTTDFEGFYKIEINNPVDSVKVSYIGYKPVTKVLKYGQSQVINFQLEEEIRSLDEIVVLAGENPAYRILRNVVDNKKVNDKRRLEAYDYESYTKIEGSLDNISDYLQKKKVVQEVKAIVDSIEVITGEDGKPVLPVFMSEAISRYYWKKNPQLRHERVLKTKVSAVGIVDGTLVSQFVGSSLQQYNFYQNWLNIASKEFVSPIADGWKTYYDYDLVDSLFLEDDFVYRLDVYPKRSQDLAFRGTIWITKDSWALKRLDLIVDQTANLNFIEKIKIQQELVPTSAGPWIPTKTRVVLDVGEITDSLAGLLVRFYSSNKDFQVNNPQKNSFYRLPVELEEDVNVYESDFWEKNRHDSLSTTEINIYQMVDTLNQVPEIKTTADMIKLVTLGYHPVGKFDLGPYMTTLAYNDVEGLRLGFGARTNINFSKKIILGGTVGYGFKDEEWKYRAYAEYIFTRKPWTTLKIESRKEVDRLFLVSNTPQYDGLLYTLARFGTLRDPFLTFSNQITLKSQVGTGVNQSVFFKAAEYKPLFDFEYPVGVDSMDIITQSDINITEIGLETRIAKDEIIVINDNQRNSLGTIKWPIITFRYTLGMDNVLNGEFSYHKLGADIRKTQKMGVFGRGRFVLAGGYIFGRLPYPLLYNHIGNESPFYIRISYNLMSFSEFVSDQYVTFKYHHHFEGFLLNRIPLLKKLKWRAVATANILWGNMRDENVRMVIPEETESGELVYPFVIWTNTPYIELGYGIENIFKFIRIDAFHRLTYLDSPLASKFGVKFSLQLVL